MKREVKFGWGHPDVTERGGARRGKARHSEAQLGAARPGEARVVKILGQMTYGRYEVIALQASR